VVLDALLPKVFALVATLEEELYGILVIALNRWTPINKLVFSIVIFSYVAFGMKLDQKTFAFERYFAYFGPREGIDACYILKDGNAHVGYSQI